MSWWRCIAVFVLVTGFWFLSRHGQALPTALPPDAPPTVFSTARASDTLARILGPEKSRFVGSVENIEARERIRQELGRIGVRTEMQSRFACNGSRGARGIRCTEINNIIGHVVEGEGPALILMAHYDSVGAGPGAGDDASGVATILETARALKAANLSARNPVLALFTDGEEAGLLGARAFVQEPAWRDRVGAVVNVEARGIKGQSLLFQTSPGDGALVDIYAANTSTYATSSLFPLIYRLLPNDTDLTPFLNAGFPSANFAFIEGATRYHTSLDRQEFLDPVTLQQHGDNVLGIARGLMQADFATLKGGSDAIYVTLLGKWLPRFSVVWALPLSLLLLVVLGASLFMDKSPRSKVRALAVVPLILVAALLSGLLLHTIAALISGSSTPAYAYPVFLRLALAVGLAAAFLWISRLWKTGAPVAAIWIWPALFAVLTSALLPGLAPYFLFPLLIAVPVLLLAQFFRSELLAAAAAIPALLIWMGMASQGEGVMGLMLHPLFTLSVAFAAIGLVPLLRLDIPPRRAWLVASGAATTVAVGIAIIAGLQPAFSAEAPQRLNLAYIEDHVAGKARWSADTLTAALRQAANFSDAPQAVLPFNLLRGYLADAGMPRLMPPQLEVKSDMQTPSGRIVELVLTGGAQMASLTLSIPRAAQPRFATVNDREIAAPEGDPSDMVITCLGNRCNGMQVRLTLGASGPFDILFAEQRQGLPPEGAKITAARGDAAVASGLGDVTVIMAMASIR